LEGQNVKKNHEFMFDLDPTDVQTQKSII